MSFFKKMFGGGSVEPEKPAPSVDYNGFTIRATPYSEGGQYQLCGVIEKNIDGELKSHRFVRAEKFPGQGEAEEFTIVKAKQMIDQMGMRLFS
ncbi:MAG: HlyU family transcriptional regulator [Beijerinckiaceae bacterium]